MRGIQNRTWSVFVFVFVLPACQLIPGEEGIDPFDAEGKADGISFFDDAVGDVEIDIPADMHGTVWVRARGRETRYRDSDIADFHRAGSHTVWRVTLGTSSTLAGMRSFLLRPMQTSEDTAVLQFARVATSVGAITPRARRVNVVSRGETLGAFVLIEHVGDRFFNRHFGDERGSLVRIRDDSRETRLLRERLMRAEEFVGEYAVSSVLDAENAAKLVAAADALGRTELDLALYALDGGVFVPVPEEGSGAISLAELQAPVSAIHAFRAIYHEGLRRAVTCLESSTCGLGTDTTRARELMVLEELDAPDGSAPYAPFTKCGPDLCARFRNPARSPFAESVTLRMRDQIGSRSVVLSYDAEADSWFSVVGPLASNFSYDYVLSDERGERHTISDPTWALGEPRVEAAELDVLRPLRELRLDVSEPSGVAIADGRLFVMGDEAHHVAEIDPETGATLDRIDVHRSGIEDLAIDPLTFDIVLADEDTGTIARFTAAGDPIRADDYGWAVDPRDGGLEGLAIRTTDGHAFLAKERGPALIAELDRHGEVLSRREVTFAPDLSALAFSEDDGFLYALSDQSRTIYRLSEDLDVLASWEIDVEKPEGLAIRQGLVYVVSDARDTLHVFELNRFRHE